MRMRRQNEPGRGVELCLNCNEGGSSVAGVNYPDERELGAQIQLVGHVQEAAAHQFRAMDRVLRNEQ